MGKIFKRAENDMIWESYGQIRPDDQENANQYNDQNVFEDEDAEAIISLEPPAPLEAEMSDSDLMSDDVFGGEEDDLDNEIITKALRKIIKRADILLNHCQGDSLDTWMVAKIIKAEDYISDVWNELDDVADFANDGMEDAEDFQMQ